MLLPALLLAVGLDPVLAVGSERFSAEAVFRKEASVSSASGSPDRSKRRGCVLLGNFTRDVLRDRSMDDARIPREARDLDRAMVLLYPSKEALEAWYRALNAPSERRIEALLESRARPDADYEIWEKRLGSEMTYNEWVRFRLVTTPDMLKRGLISVHDVDDARLQKQRDSDRGSAVEILFQEWLKNTWAKERSLDGRWTTELQDAFWSEALARRPVVFREDLECQPATPSLFRIPERTLTIQKGPK